MAPTSCSPQTRKNENQEGWLYNFISHRFPQLFCLWGACRQRAGQSQAEPVACFGDSATPQVQWEFLSA